jgi:hypothetical protein
MVNGRWAVHLLDSINADVSVTLGRTLSRKIMFEALRRLAEGCARRF